MNPLIAYLKLLRHISAEDEQIIAAHFEAKHFKRGTIYLKAMAGFIAQNPDIAIPVPLKHIPSWLGITPQSLSRTRKNIS